VKRFLALVLAVAVVSGTIPAYAQVGPRTSQKQKMDEAQPHLQKAVELYDENDFANALIEFKRAYEIAQDWRFLFNVAQAAYQVSNYALALDSFTKYLSEGGAQVERKRRTFVEGEITKLKGRVAQVRITVNVPNADIAVDDEKVGVSPLPAAITVSAGKRKFTAMVTGKPIAIKSLEVAGGDSTQISLEIESEDVKQPPPPPPPPVETRRRIPWAAWGATAGLFVVWGATGVVALVFSSDAQSKINTYGVTANDIKGAQDTARTFALVSDIALGCTVVAAGVATVMTILAKPEPVEKHPSAHFVVSPFGASVYGSF
jgi:hypothetical protein